MFVAFQGSIPKDEQYPGDNEDVLRGNARLHRLALSDGASESFDSKTWAAIVAGRYGTDPDVTANWIDAAVTLYEEHYPPEMLSWSKLAAFERGSFATLLGVSFDPALSRLSLVGIGDTTAALVSNGSLLKTFPYQRADDFQRRPELLSTKRSLNEFVSGDSYLLDHTATWDLEGLDDPVLLCVTDALGHWLLKDVEQGGIAWTQLVEMHSIDQLDALVQSERATKVLRVDDTTLAVIRFGMP